MFICVICAAVVAVFSFLAMFLLYYDGGRDSQNHISSWTHIPKSSQFDEDSSQSWQRQFKGKAPFLMGDPVGKAKRLPDVILIGAPKGGTFALIQFLGIHPAVAIAQTDMDFFSIEESFQSGFHWYLERLPWSTPGQLTMEKSPRYMFFDKVADRIHRMNEDVKLLVVVRDPVNRVVSCFVQRQVARAQQNISYTNTFEEVVINGVSGMVRDDDNCVETTLYSKHLVRWFKRFPSQQIHIVDGDMFVKNPFEELKRIEKHLGLEPWFSTDMFQYNKNKGFYCYKRPHNNREVCMPPRKGREHPEVREEVRVKLRTFFRPYNHMLYEMADKNFTWDKL